MPRAADDQRPGANFALCATLESTQGQILSQSPTDATRSWWHLGPLGFWSSQHRLTPEIVLYCMGVV